MRSRGLRQTPNGIRRMGEVQDCFQFRIARYWLGPSPAIQRGTMLIKAKALSDAAWKDVLSKNKGVKDNGLLKALGELKKVPDDAHDAADRLLDEILKLATQLKKDKSVSALPAVAKYVGELIGA